MCKSKDKQEKFAMRRQVLTGQPECVYPVFRHGNPERHKQLTDKAMTNLALFLKGFPNLITLDDACHTQNDFCGLDFASRGELHDWLKALNEDRGPLEVELTDSRTILKGDAGDVDCPGWACSRVAVVRDAGKNRKVLFVALIGDDLTDGLIKTVWLSTDNRRWNLDFENPKYKDTEPQDVSEADSQSASTGHGRASDMRSAATSRPNRANDLARAIATWNDARTDRSFAVAVWGIGVDVVFGKSVFVPTSLASDGALKAIGPVDGNGNRFYVCHIDPPDKTGQNGTAYTEVALADLLKTVLSDAQAVGLAIHLGDVRLLVGRPQLEDLFAKIGIPFEKENGNAEEEM